MRTNLLLLATISFLFHSPAVAQQDSAKQFYEIRPYLREITLKRTTSTGTVLAAPQVQVVENREAVLNVGGKALIGEEEIPSGMVLRVKVKPVAGKTVRASGMLEVSETSHPDNENDIVARESCAIHFNRAIELGQPFRVRISKSREKERWFELLVSAVPHSDINQAENHSAVVHSAAADDIPSSDK